MGGRVALLLVVASLVVPGSTAFATRVDLRPSHDGERIAVIRRGKVTYLTAKRIELVEKVSGGGYARYIRRARNGDLFVMGAGIEGRLLHSKDGGFTWETIAYEIDNLRFLSAFTILGDDTFLIAFMPSESNEIHVARSVDYGRSWWVHKPKFDLSPYTEAMAYNSGLIELADGTLLLTMDLRAGPNAVHDEHGDLLPLALKGSFPHVFRSTDGGDTWPEKSLITMYGGEAHLLELPGGKLLQCVRKQRWHRLPEDPLVPLEAKLQYGYRRQFNSEERSTENKESTNRVKNMFLSESVDGGRTWARERQVTSFLQCSGDMALLPDGTLVLEFLHRYPDDVANTGIRVKVSDDQGATWREETYILSQGNITDIDSGSCYPGTIAMENGTLISVCANWRDGRIRLEAVHWRPLSRDSSDDAHRSEPPKPFVNSLGMKMIGVAAEPFDAWTPSGTRYTRTMGSGQGADTPFAINRPMVPLRVATVADYYLSEFPVTNRMYRQFVEKTGYKNPHGKLVDFFWGSKRGSPWDLEEFAGDDLPVTAVNNVDAAKFCEWLSEKEGRRYRLPRWYEFEFADRAGTATRYWWGDRPDVRKMNYGRSLIGHPTPVGTYPPNPWGFYDMHGNVWQYCIDDAPTDSAGRGRWAGWGSAFNSPARATGADSWSNFAEGPNLMRLLSAGFRLACDEDQGVSRLGDLEAPTVVPADGDGAEFPALEVSVGESIDMGTIERNAAFFLITRDGTWVLNRKRSTDHGKTWQPCELLGEAFCQLRDGTIMAVAGDDSGGSMASFDDPFDGEGELTIQVSNDDWQTVKTHVAKVQIPLAEFFAAVRGFIELEDGRLLMTLYGRMNGDRIREDSPVGFELSIPWIKTRVILVESNDRGQSWRYVSTVSYNPHLGFEGQNENDIIRLPNGLLAVFMRTGIHGYVDSHGREHLDQPLLVTWSADEGRKWSEPERIHVEERLVTGIYPRALVTEQGVLAVLRNRPDGSVIFSPDGNGAFWSDEHIFYRRTGGQVVYADMQDMALLGPNTILVANVSRRDDAWHVDGIPITVKKKAQ